MFRPFLLSPLRCTATLLPVLALAACSTNKQVAAPVEPPPPVVEIKPQERDALGSFRFTMSDGDQKMTADQFDAWMKANGIRVAKGNDGPLEPVVVASKEEEKKKKK
ncbi:hypothetical protein RZA67_12025 [Stenotrophomonas sp. C3(2023)]|uniref:hypothetical protein n=1 Tax=Stenotrophomonas sp. C3(2023) TaxID=3080277 RepID=UPI00293CD99F|nr:hypothetical protein [Stenotrophomonas sp. C3(2023)]MDV3469446.1 hypothetical protein [Stenotrophomonas sp. C3(2023)]